MVFFGLNLFRITSCSFWEIFALESSSDWLKDCESWSVSFDYYAAGFNELIFGSLSIVLYSMAASLV